MKFKIWEYLKEFIDDGKRDVTWYNKIRGKERAEEVYGTGRYWIWQSNNKYEP